MALSLNEVEQAKPKRAQIKRPSKTAKKKTRAKAKPWQPASGTPVISKSGVHLTIKSPEEYRDTLVQFLKKIMKP